MGYKDQTKQNRGKMLSYILLRGKIRILKKFDYFAPGAKSASAKFSGMKLDLLEPFPWYLVQF